MRSMTWILIGALALGLVGCAGQPAEETEPVPKEESAEIATEDFDSGDPENVVEPGEEETP